MLASVFIVQHDKDDNIVTDKLEFVGTPREISNMVGHYHGELTYLVHENVINDYTLILSYIDNSGKVHVA